MHNPFAEVVDESTDADLIEQAKHGSRDALEKLVLRHQSWIYNIAVRMVFDAQDAEEVTQEVLIKAITRLSTFQGESQFRTWLYRITINTTQNLMRQRFRRERMQRALAEMKSGYGGTAFGEKGIAEAGGFDGYRPLVVAIADFFARMEPLHQTAKTHIEAQSLSLKIGGIIASDKNPTGGIVIINERSYGPGDQIKDARIIYDHVDGHYPSDHFPVTATVVFSPPGSR